MRLHGKNLSPASCDPGIAMPGSRLAGLKIYHVIVIAGRQSHFVFTGSEMCTHVSFRLQLTMFHILLLFCVCQTGKAPALQPAYLLLSRRRFY